MTVGAVAFVAAVACTPAGSPSPRSSSTPDDRPVAAAPSSAPSPPRSRSGWPDVPAADAPGRRSPVRFTMLFTGDVLIHRPVWEAARQADGGFDFEPLFAPLAPLVSAADRAVCHLEVPLTRDHRRLSGYPVFNGPAEVADGLAAVGFDACTTASNHTLDAGVAGVAETIDVLVAADLDPVGTATSPRQERSSRSATVAGVEVGHLAYSYGFNGFVPPADAPWTVRTIDVDRIVTDAAALRAAGARTVVVSLHFGDEYVHTPSPFQRQVAEALAAAGTVDVVIGHHAHVVQPVERIDGMWVVYGLGNMISNQSQPHRRDGLAVTVTFAGTMPDGAVSAVGLELTPLYVQRPGLVVTVADPADVDSGSHRRTVEVLGVLPDGATVTAPPR